MPIKSVILIVLFNVLVVVPVSTPAFARERMSSRCRRCSECAAAPAYSKVVGVRVYNQAQISEASLDQILDMTNRIWNPYGVSVEQSTSANAIAVVLSGITTPVSMDHGPSVLGDTLFTSGHAAPYMHLWLGNAEALATNSEIEGQPFTSRSRGERTAILMRMIGAALAHELGHYLLDTAHHSGAGLLRGALSVSDMTSPNAAHLRLTNEQQKLIRLESNRSN